MEKTVGFAIGFLISLVFALAFVWMGRRVIGWDDQAIIFGLVTMYCIAGGLEFNKVSVP